MIYLSAPAPGNHGSGGGGEFRAKKPSSDSLGATHYETLEDAAKAVAARFRVSREHALEKVRMLDRLHTLPKEEGGHPKGELDGIFLENRDIIMAGAAAPPALRPNMETAGAYATISDAIRAGSRKHGITPYHARQAIVGAIMEDAIQDTNIPIEKVDEAIRNYLEDGRKNPKRPGRRKKAENALGFLDTGPGEPEKADTKSMPPKANLRQALSAWFREYAAKGKEAGDFDEGFLKAVARNYAFRSDKREGAATSTSTFSSMIFRQAAEALVSESSGAREAVCDFTRRWRQAMNKYGRSEWRGTTDRIGEEARTEIDKAKDAGLDYDQLHIVVSTLRSLTSEY